MIYAHKLFQLPENLDAVMWKYMDFTKLIAMLENSGLFFCRADQLDDKFEGKYPKMTIEQFKSKYIEEGMTEEDAKKVLLNFKSSSDNYRKLLFISSWHLSETESVAMWKCYLQSNDGVVLKSSCKRFCDAFQNNELIDGYLGQVKYADYESDVIPHQNTFYPFLYKRKIFKYEEEVRSICLSPLPESCPESKNSDGDLIGIHQKCNLQKLISEIRVSPYASPWFKELVEKVIKRYNLKINVSVSTLSEKPYY